MVLARKYVLTKHFEGEPKRSDLTIVDEELPPLQHGEFLVEAQYLSVDPYMRPYAAQFPAGITMIGGQVAKIIESKNSEYPVGKSIVGYFGWRTHTIVNVEQEDESPLQQKPYIIPEFGDLPASLALGVLGMPGNTAYFGFLEICQPKPGETLVVSGAAGAVGSHVGQIAKTLGLKVIGIAGSDKKCEWLKKELGFDVAINYKTQNIVKELKTAAPDGVDCYFDNVGGDISSVVLYNMNSFGRVSACGSISSYNADMSKLPKSPLVQHALVFKQLKMEGFIVMRWADRWLEGIEKNLQLIRDGNLKYCETVTVGFDKMFDAFVGMLKGDNIGKAIVKIS
ncbi:prostaglandin reductase 1-like [Venturia canescens]|uniref:prostaglandin reductase 1-like n=1 Tax=Venturia canescens TaxID=32260 RepID=UPI001C9BF248|nr:prostaglandin reductase 1-like [Venturia canescens]